MSQKKGIIAAGMLTGLVILTLLALGFTNVQALLKQDKPAAPLAEPLPALQPADGASTADVQALQDYTGELEAALQTMQDRETQYRQQLEAANQTITEMQQPVQPDFGRYEDDDRYEHEEYEHEEHEHEEFEHDDD